MRELTRTVRTEIEEDDSVAALHAAVAANGRRNDEFIRNPGLVGSINRLGSRCRLAALCLRNHIVSLLHAIPALVTVHCIIAAGNSRNLPCTDLSDFCFEIRQIFSRARWRYITAIQECVHIDLPDAFLLCKAQQTIEMLRMTVHAARGYESHEMQCTAVFLHLSDDRLQRLVFEEGTIANRLRDACELLINNAAGSDVRVTNL